MRKLTIYMLLLLGYSANAIAMLDNVPHTFPSLPLIYRENKFNEVRSHFEERAKLFLHGRQFHHWKSNRPYQEIVEEFKLLDEWRQHTWYSEISEKALISRPDFMIAQDLLEKGYFKRAHLIAFQYNQTDSSYNSSTIVLNGQRFLAMEAPLNEKLTTHFFNLLQNFQVTQLVRLTAANESGIAKSVPYWTHRVKKDAKTGELILNAPFLGSKKTYPIHYYVLDSWKDHQGIDPKLLLKTVNLVKKQYDPNHGLLACHCSGGVGRSGTFLAAFLLVQEIDRQIAAGTKIANLDLSIEKIVLQLSLQRSYMVAKPAQYYTLYRLVDLYIENLQKQTPKQDIKNENKQDSKAAESMHSVQQDAKPQSRQNVKEESIENAEQEKQDDDRQEPNPVSIQDAKHESKQESNQDFKQENSHPN